MPSFIQQRNKTLFSLLFISHFIINMYLFPAISKFIAQVLAGIGPFNIIQTIDDVGEEGNIIYARTHLRVIEIGKGVKTYRK